MSQNQSSTAHTRAVQAIADARQHVRRYRFELERATVSEDNIFVAVENHPQKAAHAALMDYYEEVAQSEYIRLFGDVWQNELTDAAGNEITITVPKKQRVTVELSRERRSIIPNLNNIETKEETPNLERLRYRWAGRTIEVHAKDNSPYMTESDFTETLRLWMPPKLIKAAYSQLNDALSTVGLLAQTRAPIEHDPEPVDPKSRPWNQ